MAAAGFSAFRHAWKVPVTAFNSTQMFTETVDSVTAEQ